jgi:hypothetical protein
MRKVWLYSFSILVSRLLDALITLYGINHMGFKELNPLMAILIPHPTIFFLVQISFSILIFLMMLILEKKKYSLSKFRLLIYVSWIPVIWNLSIMLIKG